MANPFYSSAQIFKNGPSSNHEVQLHEAVPFKQTAAEIGMFPIIPLDPTNHAAFWPVERLPGPQDAIGMHGATYYINETEKKAYANDLPSMKGTGNLLAIMAVQTVSAPVGIGSVLPNIGR